MSKSLPFLILLNSLLISNCFYSHLFLNQPKCFYENLYEGMNVIFRYEIQNKELQDSSNSTSSNDRFFIDIYQGSNKNKYASFKSPKINSKFSIMIDKAGEYQFCIKSTDKTLYGKQKFIKLFFLIDTSGDSHEEELKKSITMKDFSMVNDRIENFNKKISIIEAMQGYKDKKDKKFSATQLHESHLIVMMSIIQISIICLIGIIHILRLRKVFKQKIWSPF